MVISVQLPGSLSHLSNSYLVDSNMYWHEFINELLGEYYKFLFDIDVPREYILIFLNGTKLDSLKEIRIQDNDSLNILSAISGG